MADLARLRDDLGAFADAVGLPLTSSQVASLGLEQRTTVVVAPRQSGKSRSLVALATWWAFRRPGQRVLVVSAGEEAARRLLAEVRHLVVGSPLLSASVVDETAALVSLSNGSEVRSVPASERQVRGWTTDLLLVDEASLVSDDLLLGAAIPTTAARPDARIVLASSASVASGAFFDAAVRGERGSEHTRTFRWALRDARWIAPSVIEAAKESMSPQRFMAEYEGVFASGADSLFSRATLDRATGDFATPGWPALRGPARVLAGTDWGATVDRSALVAVARLAVDGAPLYGVVAAHRWPAGAPLDGPGGVVGEIADSGAHFDTLSLEVNGLGLPVSQALDRRMAGRAGTGGGGRERVIALPSPWEIPDVREWARARDRAMLRQGVGGATFHTRRQFVTTSAGSKAATYSELRLLLDRGQLVLPAGVPELTRELLLLRVTLTETSEKIHAAGSGHDDLADALMLAAGPYRDREGAWRTRLGDLLDARRDLPPCADPEHPGEVSTGAGRWLPRAPVLQSVDGVEVSRQIPTPPPPEPEPRRVGRFLIDQPERGSAR
jgi:hypothetical protein